MRLQSLGFAKCFLHCGVQVWAGCGAAPGPRRAGHLVFQRAVAVRDAGVARRGVAGLSALLPDECHGDGARHPVFLGGPHDHDGAGVHRETPLQHGLPPRPGEPPADTYLFFIHSVSLYKYVCTASQTCNFAAIPAQY